MLSDASDVINEMVSCSWLLSGYPSLQVVVEPISGVCTAHWGSNDKLYDSLRAALKLPGEMASTDVLSLYRKFFGRWLVSPY